MGEQIFKALVTSLFIGVSCVATASQSPPDIYLQYTITTRAIERMCGRGAMGSTARGVEISTVEEYFSGVKHAKFTRGIQYSLGANNPCDIVVEGPYIDSEIDDGEFRYTWRNNKPATKTISPVKRRAAVQARAGKYNAINPGMAKALAELKDWPALAQGLGAHIRAEETGDVLGHPCKTIQVVNNKMCWWAPMPVYGPLKHPVMLSLESEDTSALASDFVVGKPLPRDIFKVPAEVTIKNGRAQ